MPSSQNVLNLKINKLTQAQYETAVQQGVIGDDELSFLTDVEYPTMITPQNMPVLVANGWSSNSQTVQVAGVTASNNVIVAPAPASAADYASAGIVCTAQGSGTLTFTCTSVPSSAITVNVMILG